MTPYLGRNTSFGVFAIAENRVVRPEYARTTLSITYSETDPNRVSSYHAKR